MGKQKNLNVPVDLQEVSCCCSSRITGAASSNRSRVGESERSVLIPLSQEGKSEVIQEQAGIRAEQQGVVRTDPHPGGRRSQSLLV